MMGCIALYIIVRLVTFERISFYLTLISKRVIRLTFVKL
jgi:hypothetical protein